MTIAVGLLDTNILIDISRGYVPAISWMKNNSDLSLAIPSLVRMEMILGTQNKFDLQRVVATLDRFPITYPNEADAQWAMEQFEHVYLSHQIEIIDCFIAAIAIRLSLPLYTRNTKHLSIFKNLLLNVPY